MPNSKHMQHGREWIKWYVHYCIYNSEKIAVLWLCAMSESKMQLSFQLTQLSQIKYWMKLSWHLVWADSGVWLNYAVNLLTLEVGTFGLKFKVCVLANFLKLDENKVKKLFAFTNIVKLKNRQILIIDVWVTVPFFFFYIFQNPSICLSVYLSWLKVLVVLQTYEFIEYDALFVDITEYTL